MKYLVGIDNGGTFSKAAVFTADGRQVAVAKRQIPVLTPHPGYTERDMDALWEANAACVREAVEQSGCSPADIAGVSFSGHGKGLYLLGENDFPIYNGILSTDCRAWEYVTKWKADGTMDRVFPLTLQTVLACQPVSLLAWLRDREPEVYGKIKWVFAVKDYIRYKLTGEACAEYSDFSGANLVNLRTGEYDQEILSCFGLSDLWEKLPPLRRAADLCGQVTAEASRLTLLPEGTPVAGGMFDVDACGLASGLTDESQMCMVAGTWSINEYIAREPIGNKTVDLNSFFCIPDYYLIEESSPTSAGNLEWFVKNLMDGDRQKAKERGVSIYQLADEIVESIPPEDNNIIFLPFLNGSNEDALAKGTFIGLTGYHGKGHMLRAVFEGIVFSHLTHVNKLLRNREKPASIRLSGGAAKSDVWVQIFADVLQIPIDVIEDKELGAQGAAIAAGICAGLYQDYQDGVSKTVHITKMVLPREEYRAVYEEKYKVYRKVVEALSPVWSCFENE